VYLGNLMKVDLTDVPHSLARLRGCGLQPQPACDELSRLCGL